METSYITSAAEPHQLPHLGAPEIAMLGRSNCGKSSLINALLQRTRLARVSTTPGRTQMANFFQVKNGHQQLMVVDLPGYGYSSVGREARRPWQPLVEAYITRDCVRECLLLLDARRVAEPLDADDAAVARLLASRNELGVVLTKTDKLNQSETARARAMVQRSLAAVGVRPVRVVAVSSLKGTGIDALRAAMWAYMEDLPKGP